MEKGYQYTDTHEIGYFDVDKNKNLKIPTLIDICNNASSLHSEVYGVGINYLKENNYGWVFLKMSLTLNRVPKYLETIKLTTYSVGTKRFFASRYFEIHDEKGEVVGILKGLYCLIDTTTRKPIPIPEGLMEKYGTFNKYITLRDLRLSPFESADRVKNFEVRYYDIDTNGHVNNGIYPLWGFESLPLTYHDEKQLASLDIIFEKEVFYGDHLRVETKNDDENTILQTIYNGDNEVTTLLRSTWKDL